MAAERSCATSKIEKFLPTSTPAARSLPQMLAAHTVFGARAHCDQYRPRTIIAPAGEATRHKYDAWLFSNLNNRIAMGGR
jgi:hypothetical protein